VSQYTKTVSQIAAEVPAAAGTVRRYADAGMVPSIRGGHGHVRMFKADAAAIVRLILAELLAMKGRYARA
jgi:hypothetical protein